MTDSMQFCAVCHSNPCICAGYEAMMTKTVTHIAILRRHDVLETDRAGSLYGLKAVIVPPGQSLDFDEGPGATRKWLLPYLGDEWHLVNFLEVDHGPKDSPDEPKEESSLKYWREECSRLNLELNDAKKELEWRRAAENRDG